MMTSSCSASDLWDRNLTWDTEGDQWPDFTHCFHLTVVSFFPLCVFLLSLPFWDGLSSGVRGRRKGGGTMRWSRWERARAGLLASIVALQIVEFLTCQRIADSSLLLPSLPPLSSAARLSPSAASLLLLLRGVDGAGTGPHFFCWMAASASLGINAYSANVFGQERGWSEMQALLLPAESLLALLIFLAGIPLGPPSSEYTRLTIDDDVGQLRPRRSFASHLFFSWFTPTVLRGRRRPLRFEDMVTFERGDRADRIRARWEESWDRLHPQGSSEKEVRVVGNIVAIHLNSYLLSTFLDILCMLMQQALPRFQGLLIAHASSQEEAAWKGYLYAVTLFTLTVVDTAVQARATFILLVMGTKIRSALMMAIHNKVLKLSSSARKMFSDGEVMNLLNDCSQFNDLSYSINTVFNAAFIIGFSLWNLWGYLGPSCLAGLVVMVLTIPVNSVLTKWVRHHQKRGTEFRDLRMKITSEVVDGVKVIKFNAWEEAFIEKIGDVRRRELKHLRTVSYLKSAQGFFMQSAPFLVAIASFAAYVWSDPSNVLDAEKAFVSISYFNMIRHPMGWLPNFFSQMTQASVSIDRMSRLLGAREVEPKVVLSNASDDNAFSVNDASFSWDGGRATLHLGELGVRKGELVGVVGKVGDGKSSFLSSLLGEMERMGGSVTLNSTTAYVPAEAFIRNATLRDNILFGELFNKIWYDQVIHACGLLPDLDLLPAGDLTEIGEKGVNLSGGQKQRVALARAIYSQRELYLLDDPLSAVDVHVGRHIFDHCLHPKHGLLKGRTVVMVTNSVTYLPQVDRVIVIQDGSVVATGDFESIKREFPFLNMQLSNSDSSTKRQEEYSEVSKNLSQLNGATNKNIGDKLVEEEKVKTGSVSSEVYLYYFRRIGMAFVVGALLLHFVSQTFFMGTNLWLAKWTSMSEEEREGGGEMRNVTVYGVFGSVSAATVVAATLAVLIGGIHASVSVHGDALRGVLRSPLLFFESNPKGRILNRLSHDLFWMDSILPENYGMGAQAACEMMCTIFVICYTNWGFVFALGPLVLAAGTLQSLHVKASRQIKRINSVKMSPVFSLLSESLSGVSTVRAFDAQKKFVKEEEANADVYTVGYLNNCFANHWIRVRQEMTCNFFALLAALFSASPAGRSLSPGIVGLSISYALGAGPALRTLYRTVAQIEARMVCVERLKEYVELQPEQITHSGHFDPPPPPEWPEKGEVRFDSFRARYRPHLDPALDGVSLSVGGGEKVGIVGRTGAGKSTITVALFRLLDLTEGTLSIDGRPVDGVSLEQLRSRMTIIPQEPLLFSGSLRFNVDPFGRASDPEVEEALRKAHLTGKIGPSTEVGEKGSNLSSGQRQLVCLARALLRRSKIVVLDEATAAVDPETDALVQRTVLEEFSSSTVLTIAHRLDTIMDTSDRVVVMDRGRVAEEGTPKELLGKEHSIFKGMVNRARNN